jgi:hypothetical protein
VIYADPPWLYDNQGTRTALAPASARKSVSAGLLASRDAAERKLTPVE